MWHADDRRLLDPRQVVDEKFYFFRIDVQPAADDDVLGAADDRYISILVDQALIAGVEKAVVGEVFGRFVGQFPIAFEYVRAAYLQVADLAGVMP
jgi:hypothetical protein